MLIVFLLPVGVLSGWAAFFTSVICLPGLSGYSMSELAFPGSGICPSVMSELTFSGSDICFSDFSGSGFSSFCSTATGLPGFCSTGSSFGDVLLSGFNSGCFFFCYGAGESGMSFNFKADFK